MKSKPLTLNDMLNPSEDIVFEPLYRKQGPVLRKNSPAECVRISEKYLLTIKDASVYFSIGVKRLRRLAEDYKGVFSIQNGSRYLIVRTKFEEFLEDCKSI